MTADLPEAAQIPGPLVALATMLELDTDVRRIIRWRGHSADKELVAESMDDLNIDPADHWRVPSPQHAPASRLQVAKTA
jgi:hypothetical protein